MPPSPEVENPTIPEHSLSLSHCSQRTYHLLFSCSKTNNGSLMPISDFLVAKLLHLAFTTLPLTPSTTPSVQLLLAPQMDISSLLRASVLCCCSLFLVYMQALLCLHLLPGNEQTDDLLGLGASDCCLYIWYLHFTTGCFYR